MKSTTTLSLARPWVSLRAFVESFCATTLYPIGGLSFSWRALTPTNHAPSLAIATEQGRQFPYRYPSQGKAKCEKRHAIARINSRRGWLVSVLSFSGKSHELSGAVEIRRHWGNDRSGGEIAVQLRPRHLAPIVKRTKHDSRGYVRPAQFMASRPQRSLAIRPGKHTTGKQDQRASRDNAGSR